MEKLDAQVTGWINNLSGHNNLIDVFMVAVTQAGVPLLILAVVASWWWGGGGRTERHVAVACGLSFLLGLTLNQIVLLLVHRVRPYDAGVSHLLIARSADPSFPSDHATASFDWSLFGSAE